MTAFIKGKELSEKYFHQIVKPILQTHFPDLRYSAALIGPGSDVLGFDTERSRDHDWGPRVLLFVEEKSFHLTSEISKTLSKYLPSTFLGYSTHFSQPDDIGVVVPKKAKAGDRIHHLIKITSIKAFFQDYLNVDPFTEFTKNDWLSFSSQKLRTIEFGRIFHNELDLTAIQQKFTFYPDQIWFTHLASQWKIIAEEEAFIGRCGEVGDKLGSKLIAGRLIETIMHLCFLMERQYAPYSKWFGTAFSQLNSAKTLQPIFTKILTASTWQTREQHLSLAYQFIAEMHNKLEITEPLPTKVSQFHDRPFLVIHADRFVGALKKQIIKP